MKGWNNTIFSEVIIKSQRTGLVVEYLPAGPVVLGSNPGMDVLVCLCENGWTKGLYPRYDKKRLEKNKLL